MIERKPKSRHLFQGTDGKEFPSLWKRLGIKKETALKDKSNREYKTEESPFAKSLKKTGNRENNIASLPLHTGICCNEDTYIPAKGTILSLIRQSYGSKLVVYVFTDGLSQENTEELLCMNAENVIIEMILIRNPFSFCSLRASLPETEKIILLSPGVIVRKDLSFLCRLDMGNKAACAAPNVMGLFYKDAPAYDDGVVVLRPSELEETSDLQSLPRDKICLLPLNCCLKAAELYSVMKEDTLADINRRFAVHYETQKDLFTDAAVIHFTGDALPWKDETAPFAYEWLRVLRPVPQTAEHSEKYLISVVMPTYNVASYIEATVECILNQSCPDLELICADDGSTDGTLEILRTYEKKHQNMKVLSGENVNAGYERNKGSDIAQGKYIYYMDSDDLLSPDALETMVEYAETMRLDVAYFEGNSFFEREELRNRFSKLNDAYKRKYVYSCVYEGWELYTKLRNHLEFVLQPCMKITRARMLKEQGIRFSEVKQMNDSLHSYLTVFAAERCGVLPLTFYHRRVRDNSLVTNTGYKNVQRMAESRATIWVGLIQLARKWKHKPEAYTYLMKAAERAMRELTEAMEHGEEGPDFSFIGKHWTPEQIMAATAEWIAYTQVRENDGRIMTAEQMKARIEKLEGLRSTKSFHLYLMALKVKNRLTGKEQ